jgi:crotonobetainyl-CoA:carnitine CoA-transferase CaiB-like acyl-CoA transferase
MVPTPLRGLKVVDLSQYIAGAVCGQVLADFGAQVLKVEPISGDPSRALPGSRFGSIYYRTFNTGKQAIALDLRREDDHDRLRDLLADADALVMNFGQRSRERLGLGWPTLHADFPRLVVTLVSAYGAEDPRTCFDSIAQAVSGFAVLNAAEDGRPRISAGYPTDVFSGLYAGLSTAMTLLDAERRDGVLVDVAMIEVAMAALTGPASLIAAEEGAFHAGRGNRDAATAPSNVYRCRDGYAYVYAGLDKHWARLRPLIGADDLDAPTRLADAERLDAVVESWTAGLTVAEVCERMAALEVPAGPVHDPVEALRVIASERPGAVVARTAAGAAVPQFPAVFSGARVARSAAPEAPTTQALDGPRRETAQASPTERQ